jgi:hypothetical protein
MPQEFQELTQLFVGLGGRVLEQIGSIPHRMSQIFGEDETPPGLYKINVVVDVPEEWTEKCQMTLDRIAKRMKAENARRFPR